MEWLIAANPKKYDHATAFAELPFIDWKQTVDYEVGDTVLVYTSNPIMAVLYVARVEKACIGLGEAQRDEKYWLDSDQWDSGIANGRFARMRLERRLPPDLLTLSKLHSFGMQGNIQGPRRLRGKDGTLHPWAEKALNVLHDYAMAEESKVEEAFAWSSIDSASLPEKVGYKLKPMARKDAVVKNGVAVYPRDPKVAAGALKLAGHSCEIDRSHPTFIKRSSGLPYTEAHHLIHLEFFERFSSSLDVEENVVSLCSNCHNEIHYGRDAAGLVSALYSARKEKLELAGVPIELDELLSMYGIEREP